MLEVVGHRVLVKPEEVKDQFEQFVPEGLKSKGFEVAMTAEQERREAAGTQVGTVIGVGPTAFRAFDGSDPNWQPWCKVGDRIVFARYAGKFVEDPVTTERFMVINDEDVQVVVKGERDPFQGALDE